jgi:hypothetical protein
MLRLYSGALLLIVGITGFIVDAANHPVAATRLPGDFLTRHELAEEGVHASSVKGFSHTLYDAVHIGACTLIVLGALTLAVGLMRYRAQLRAEFA